MIRLFQKVKKGPLSISVIFILFYGQILKKKTLDERIIKRLFKAHFIEKVEEKVKNEA